MIFDTISTYPILPLEKLALSWLVYLSFGWYIVPSFAKLSILMRPTACQFCIQHLSYTAPIVWLSIRECTIAHRYRYRLEDIVGLLSFTLRFGTSLTGSFN
ncbi:hypothetical protein BD289DRAFT_487938 [Coniella lustricola]|uniref:Uncharacterized protein n=1 Tax=Coniella lustricola TaxID=2025994 RepID=A0A2T3A4L9_9PEZI|nr:hypothetical protein BD289DRAFT_487938 [Coniella lustricola]